MLDFISTLSKTVLFLIIFETDIHTCKYQINVRFKYKHIFTYYCYEIGKPSFIAGLLPLKFSDVICFKLYVLDVSFLRMNLQALAFIYFINHTSYYVTVTYVKV